MEITSEPHSQGSSLPDWSSCGWDWELMPWEDGLITFLYTDVLAVVLHRSGSVAIVRPADEGGESTWVPTRPDAVFASLADFGADCLRRPNVGLLMWFLDVLEEAQQQRNPAWQS